MKNIGCLILIIIFNGCIREEPKIFIKTFLENKTSKEIQLVFYNNSQEKEKIILKANDKILNSIFFVNERILNKGASPPIIETLGPNLNYLYSSKFKIDSLFVFFVNNKTTVHLAYQVVSNNQKALKTTDLRNIFSFDSYTINETKANVSEAIYTFTEQDYLDAKVQK